MKPNTVPKTDLELFRFSFEALRPGMMEPITVDVRVREKFPLEPLTDICDRAYDLAFDKACSRLRCSVVELLEV